MKYIAIIVSSCCLTLMPLSADDTTCPTENGGKKWLVHSIELDPDDAGPDGIRMADVNKDGLMDIVTGWEEGDVSKIYLNPGFAAIKDPWPASNIMTFYLGHNFKPEDAFAADVDGDGHLDLISSSDGGSRRPQEGRGIKIHFSNGHYTSEAAADWQEMDLVTASTNMYTRFWDVNMDGHADIVSGGKGGMLSWWQAPVSDKRIAANWIKHDVAPVAWVMSNIPYDVDGDGDMDIVYSDRQDNGGEGAFWFENPGAGEVEKSNSWTRREIAPTTHVMFMTIADVDRDGIKDFVMTDHNSVTYARRTNRKGIPEVNVINIPAKLEGWVKGINVANLDGDDDMEVLLAWKGSIGYLDHDGSPNDVNSWTLVDTCIRANKFDNIFTFDMDGDGDLDALTTEENSGLGVVWFENPLK